MAMITLMADEDGGTYKTLSKWAIPITTNATLIPCRLEGTSPRLNYGDGPIDGLVSAQSHFS
jgi:hypothetical protein